MTAHPSTTFLLEFRPAGPFCPLARPDSNPDLHLRAIHCSDFLPSRRAL